MSRRRGATAVDVSCIAMIQRCYMSAPSVSVCKLQCYLDTDAKIERMEKELTNANELLEVSRQHERQLTCHDDAEIVSSAAANVSRLIKSGMTLTQVRLQSLDLVFVCSVFE